MRDVVIFVLCLGSSSFFVSEDGGQDLGEVLVISELYPISEAFCDVNLVGQVQDIMQNMFRTVAGRRGGRGGFLASVEASLPS